MSSSHKLDLLPTEIIKKIAGFSHTSSVLSLIRVNRHLHSVCNDNSVFKAIISHRNNDSEQLQEAEEEAWNPPLTTEYVRYALADERAREWRDRYYQHLCDLNSKENKDLYSEACKDIFSWAPKLLSLHHPLVDASRLVVWLENLSAPSVVPSAVYNAGLHFIVTCAVLSEAQPWNSSNEEGWQQVEKIKVWVSVVEAKPLETNSGPILALIARSLFIHSRTDPSAFPISLPSPLKIAFPAEFLPLPFSGISANDFTSSHLEAMTSKSFLEDGEWVGYYCYNRTRPGIVIFDPPMTGIKFACKEDGGVVYLTGAGIDKVGPFEMVGKVVMATGEVQIRKTYISHTWWDYQGKMTPFGIVGLWGRDEVWARDMGSFWLWKREWSIENELASG